MAGPVVLPETAAVLDFLAAQEAPHIADLPVSDMRAVYGLLNAAFDEAPDPSVRTVDFEGGGCPLRAYFAGEASAGPVIVYMHGGGWVIGDLESHDGFCRMIAKLTGLRVVAVDYALAPEQPFPRAHDDCLAAATFIASSPPQLEAPVTGIAVAGDSAGGNLALHVSAQLGSANVLAQMLIYPVGDCTGPAGGSFKQFEEGYLLDRKLMDRFIADYFPGGSGTAHPHASPLLHPIPEDLPPSVIVTAGLDPLRDQGRELAGKFVAQGVETHYFEAEGLIHGMATMRKSLPTGDSILRQATAIFAGLISKR